MKLGNVMVRINLDGYQGEPFPDENHPVCQAVFAAAEKLADHEGVTEVRVFLGARGVRGYFPQAQRALVERCRRLGLNGLATRIEQDGALADEVMTLVQRLT